MRKMIAMVAGLALSVPTLASAADCPTAQTARTGFVLVTKDEPLTYEVKSVDGHTEVKTTRNGTSNTLTYFRLLPMTSGCPNGKATQYRWETPAESVPVIAVGQTQSFRARMTDCKGEEHVIESTAVATAASSITIGACTYPTVAINRTILMDGRLFSDIVLDFSFELGWVLRSEIFRPGLPSKTYAYSSIAAR